MATVIDRQGAGGVAYDAGLRDYMLSVYRYVGYGFGVSAASAWFIHRVATTPVQAEGAKAFGKGLWLTPAGEALYGLPGMIGLLVVGIGLIFVMKGTVGRGSLGGSMGLYLAFTAVFGIALAASLGRLVPGIAFKATAITAFTFGSMSLYGYTTKRDLSGLGSFLTVGLIALIGIGLLNALVFKSGAMELAASAAGVILFIGWIAYDTQKIKDAYDARLGRGSLGALAVWGAMDLYLDALNLLLNVARILSALSGDD